MRRGAALLVALAACSEGAPAAAPPASPPAPTPRPTAVTAPSAAPAVPAGIDPRQLEGPPENPTTPAKVALGAALFFDPRLSADGTVSCASCHDPARAFTDGRPVAVGIGGKAGTRNTPTILNRALRAGRETPLFFDGRAATLEAQVLVPLAHPLEMASPPDRAAAAIAAVPGYAPLFAAAFGDPAVDAVRIARAIAAFERTLVSGDSALDRFQIGGAWDALSPAALEGRALFLGKAGCVECHGGYNLTDERFHNLGVGMDAPSPDLGRFLVTGKEEDRGAFKTPTLRDVARTAPYMHDGSLPTLAEVVDFYDRGGTPNRWLDPDMAPLGLTVPERAALVAFLEALDGATPVVVRPDLPR